MLKIIGKSGLQQFSREIFLSTQIKVRDLPKLLGLPEELTNNLIVVRKNYKLDYDEPIFTNDEIYLFMAVMGG